MSITRCEVLDHNQVLPAVTSWLQEDRPIHEQLHMSTMCLSPTDPQVADLTQSCIASARTGRTIGLAVDAYTLLEPRAIGPLTSRHFSDTTGKTTERERTLATLTEAGVNVSVVNNIGPVENLYTNRLHIKAHVMGDDLIIGGPNMDGTNRFDMGIRLTSPLAASFVRNLLISMIDSGTTKSLGDKDIDLRVDGSTHLLVDVGRQGQSIIYDTAMDVISSARSYLVYCSQYPPTGTERRELERAVRRGVKTYVVGNDPKQHAHFPELARLAERMRGLRQTPGLTLVKSPTSRQKIHTKGIATEDTWVVGSHNFARVGVWLGTSEASIVQHDASMALTIARTALLQGGIHGEIVDEELSAIGWAAVGS